MCDDKDYFFKSMGGRKEWGTLRDGEKTDSRSTDLSIAVLGVSHPTAGLDLVGIKPPELELLLKERSADVGGVVELAGPIVVEDLGEDARVSVEEVLVEYGVVVGEVGRESGESGGGNLLEDVLVGLVPDATDIQDHARLRVHQPSSPARPPSAAITWDKCLRWDECRRHPGRSPLYWDELAPKAAQKMLASQVGSDKCPRHPGRSPLSTGIRQAPGQGTRKDSFTRIGKCLGTQEDRLTGGIGEVPSRYFPDPLIGASRYLVGA